MVKGTKQESRPRVKKKKKPHTHNLPFLYRFSYLKKSTASSGTGVSVKNLGRGCLLRRTGPRKPLAVPQDGHGKVGCLSSQTPEPGRLSFCASFSKVLFHHGRKLVLGTTALHRKEIPLKNHQHLCRLGAPIPPPDESPFLPAPGSSVGRLGPRFLSPPRPEGAPRGGAATPRAALPAPPG